MKETATIEVTAGNSRLWCGSLCSECSSKMKNILSRAASLEILTAWTYIQVSEPVKDS